MVNVNADAKPRATSWLADPFPLYFGLTMAYGLVNGLTSPVLPELAEQASLSPEGLGALFIWRGFGSMAGAFAIGVAVDLARDPHTVLAAVLLLRGAACVCMPAGTTLAELALTLSAVAFGGNGIYVCGSTGLSWTYGKLMGARVSLMDAAFGLGGSFSPALAAALLGAGFRSVDGYRVIAGFDVLFLLAACVLQAKRNPKFSVNDLPEPRSVDGLGSASSLREKLLGESEETPPNLDGERDVGGAREGRRAPCSRRQPAGDASSTNWIAVALCGCIILLADVCMSSVLFWFFEWSTEELQIEAALARALNTAFWACFTGIQFVWAFLQSRYGVQPQSILQFLLPFSLLASAGIALPGSVGAACMVGLGLAAGMNALVTTLLRQRSSIGGKVFAVLRIASACGNMLGGALVGFLRPGLGSLALPAVAAGSTAMNIVLLLILVRTPGSAR